MTLFNLAEFSLRLAPNARLLGLDPGSKRIGVALSDVGRRIASPYTVLTRAKLKQNAAEIAAIIAKEGVGGLMIGLPLDEDAENRAEGAGGAGLGACAWRPRPGCRWRCRMKA